MTLDELNRLVGQALVAAVDGDADTATRAVCEIGARSRDDQLHVYLACRGFAEAARQALVKMHGEAPVGADERIWGLAPVTAETDPADVFALRFIVAHANNDEPNRLALWRSALLRETDDYVRCVAVLLATTALLITEANR